MALRSWRTIAAVALLGIAGGAATSTTYPTRAYVFVKEFERTSKGKNQVSVWERVVYSLIEAKDRGAECGAPKTI
jgi:hypothetical protein